MLKTIFGIFIIVVIASVAEAAMSISRSEIIANAETWMHPPVPHSQKKYKDGYRTDCSGYVSMAWNTGTNYNTNTLETISTVIEKDDLKSGDILLKMGTHVVIFESWTDSTKTKYLGYEQAGGSAKETKHWEIPYPIGGVLRGMCPENIST